MLGIMKKLSRTHTLNDVTTTNMCLIVTAVSQHGCAVVLGNGSLNTCNTVSGMRHVRTSGVQPALYLHIALKVLQQIKM